MCWKAVRGREDEERIHFDAKCRRLERNVSGLVDFHQQRYHPHTFISPTSGPTLTSITVDGSGFAPNVSYSVSSALAARPVMAQLRVLRQIRGVFYTCNGANKYFIRDKLR